MRSIRLEAIRQSSKEKLFIIPYLFTFLNAFFGFLSIIKTLEYDFSAAAYCIIIAGCMDLFDGRLARALGSASYFGMELDSLCDVVSFCIAPTVLLYNWYVESLGIPGLLVLSLYLCIGLSRLAKFNIRQDEQNKFFLGLPTPVAAFFLADLVLHSAQLAEIALWFFLDDRILLYLIAGLALLMIAPIQFPSFKYYTLRMRSTYNLLAVLIMLLLVCSRLGYPFFFVVTLLYIVGSCGYAVYKIFIPKHSQV